MPNVSDPSVMSTFKPSPVGDATRKLSHKKHEKQKSKLSKKIGVKSETVVSQSETSKKLQNEPRIEDAVILTTGTEEQLVVFAVENNQSKGDDHRVLSKIALEGSCYLSLSVNASDPEHEQDRRTENATANSLKVEVNSPRVGEDPDFERNTDRSKMELGLEKVQTSAEQLKPERISSREVNEPTKVEVDNNAVQPEVTFDVDILTRDVDGNAAFTGVMD